MNDAWDVSDKSQSSFNTLYCSKTALWYLFSIVNEGKAGTKELSYRKTACLATRCGAGGGGLQEQQK